MVLAPFAEPFETVLIRQHVSIAIGFVSLLFFASFFARHVERNEKIAKLGLLGIIWFFAQYVGYFVQSPHDSLLVTSHRYLTTSLVGMWFMIVVWLFLCLPSVWRYVGILTIFSTLVFLINMETSSVVRTISDPTRAFYKAVLKELPAIPPDAIIFFDLYHDPQLIYRFRSNYPSGALAFFYGFPKHVRVVSSREDLLVEFRLTPDIEKVYALCVTHDAVTNTTSDMRRQLKSL